MPFGPSDTIRNAVDRLLSASKPGEQGGFVIFDDGNDIEYVQFSVEPEGLVLFWPEEGPRVPSTDRSVPSLLQSFDFREVADLKKMAARVYVTEDDGIYAQFGRDVDLVENFTSAAFEKVYGRFGVQTLNSRVET
jgi:hypothetical protein